MPRPRTRLSGSAGRPFTRREFLVVTTAATAGLMLDRAEGWARRVPRMRMALQPWSLPADPPALPIERARALIGAAVLAPSDWNTQPWRFEVETTGLRLVADPQRALPVGDPDQRAMHAALGGALENLLVAARAWGLKPVVEPLPFGGARGVVAAVEWSPGETRRDRPMFEAIAARRTNRRDYDGRALDAVTRAQLAAQMPDGVRLHWLDGREPIRDLADLVHDAVSARTRDRRLQGERRAWMRLGDEEIRRRGDGMSFEALDVGGPARWFASRYFDPDGRLLGFGAGSLAKRAREQVRSCGAIGLITVPDGSPAAWLACGQACQRLALKATQLGVAHHLMSDVARHEPARGELLRRFRAGAAEQPLAIVRFGRAKPVAASPRRATSVVASFRAS